MTGPEIVQDFIDHYCGYPERFSGEIINHRLRCLFTDSKGCHCAIGRCLSEETLLRIRQHEDPQMVNATAAFMLVRHFSTDGTLDSLLKPQYRGQDMMFWNKLQNLHDDYQSTDDLRKYWTGGAYLNEEGRLNLPYVDHPYSIPTR